MPKSATERDKYFQKLKMDDVPKLSITSSEWQNDRPNWSEDVVLLDLQASTLMLDPINMYRDEISLSQAKDPTGDEEKQNKSSSAVSLNNQKSRRNDYVDQFKEDLQQRRERLKEEIRNMSYEIQQASTTTRSSPSEARLSRISTMYIVPTNTPTSSAERAARFQWESRKSDKLLTEVDTTNSLIG